MNRGFKFRAWNDRAKLMSKDIGVGIMYEQLNNFYREKTGNQNFCIEWNQTHLMQFTGLLHPKTGVEIYEGDIFRQEIEHDKGDERNYLSVFWVKQRAAFYLVDVCHLPVLKDNDC